MSPYRKKKKYQKSGKITEFNEIFSIAILMNKKYNAPVILFKNVYIFSGQLTLNPFENLCYASKIHGSKLTDLKKNVKFLK